MDSERILVHQRRMRRSRIRHVLSLEDDVLKQMQRRDSVLGPLSAASRRPSVEFGAASEDLVDLAVSVGLIDAPEPPERTLGASALALTILAADGQFARLRALAERVRDIAGQLSEQRPFLVATLESLSLVITGRFDEARGRLAMALGAEDEQPLTRRPRTPEQLGDLLVAVTVREWLHEAGLTLADKVRQLAIEHNDGELLALIDFVHTLASAVDIADLGSALQHAGIDTRAQPWSHYLSTTTLHTLLPAQLSAINAGVLDSRTRVVALPTSSGKTLIAELRIASALVDAPGRRALYIAPYRLLARQVERQLRRGLRPFGLGVADLGGAFNTDLDPYAVGGVAPTNGASERVRPPRDEAEQAGLPDVGICTPERLDALLRLASSDRSGATAALTFFDSLELLVFDELQLVGRPGRGPRFELLLTRLKSRYPRLPMLGLSAASVGAEDLAEWLGDERPIVGGTRPTGTLEVLWRTDGALLQRFGRGVKKVAELPRTSTASQDAAVLASRIPVEYAPVLIVETTRPWAENVAKRLLREAAGNALVWRTNLTDAQRAQLTRVIEEVGATLGWEHPLVLLLREGIAYHHAGVPPHLLRSIESLANDKCLRFLVATTTVAEGADLPFQVVLIPHLAFQGVTGRIERDLYLNLVGRAGRTNVAVEGTVIVLDSDARKLRNHVRGSLWSETQRDRVRGLLDNLGIAGHSLESLSVLRDVQQQLLAWIGEDGAYVENQTRAIASQTFTWATGDARQREKVLRAIDRSFDYLEGQQLVVAGSPYRLTPLGRRARLAGLSVRSCLRLADRMAGIDREFLASLSDKVRLTPEECRGVARLAFDTLELIEQGLWMRRRHPEEKERVATILALENARRNWPEADDLFQADVALLGAWLSGTDYVRLGEAAPTFERGTFASTDSAQRASDAAELLGRMTFPASWSWSAVRAMGDETRLPVWVTAGLEFGVPTQSATALIGDFGLSRDGALRLAQVVSARWDEASEQVEDVSEGDALDLGLTRADAVRLVRGHA